MQFSKVLTTKVWSVRIGPFMGDGGGGGGGAGYKMSH